MTQHNDSASPDRLAPGKPNQLPGPPANAEPNGGPPPDEAVSEPAELKIQQAMDFYRATIRTGPRLAREVMREGRLRGLPDRTQWRARYLLNVQSLHLPGMGTRRLIALPGNPAMAAYKQGKRAKTRQPTKPGTASQIPSTTGG